jgi:glucokinase
MSSFEIIVADIGGTHARFAIAQITDGHIASLDHQVTMKAADHASLQIAWEAYGRTIKRDLPANGAIAVAAPVGGEVLHLTNSSWMIRPKFIPEKLHLDRYTLINDFGAVGHSVAQLERAEFTHICGPDAPETADGITTIVGPGTGLGVAHVMRMGGKYIVTETEGGHVDFAPCDGVEDRILAELRKHHRRVSVERVVSGPGLQVIYKVLADMEGKPAAAMDDKALWQLALSDNDSIAAAAFDRFCLCLGSYAGDAALLQGAQSLIVAGGLGTRIADRLASSGFRERFTAKGRFQSLMEQIPVLQLRYDEPGLYGAAAAFLHQYS